MRYHRIICPYCQAEFLVLRKRQKYCSPKHRRLMWKKRHRDKENAWQKKRKFWLEWYAKNKKVKILSRKCLACQKEFTPDWRHNFQKFCSAKCRRRVYRPIYREGHGEQLRQKDNEYKSRTRFGAVSKTLNRKVVEERDGGICKLCGRAKEVIHHIRYSGKPEDLVSLCRACHASIHQKFSKEPYWEET